MSSRPGPQGQHWDPDRYARNARFVADLGMPVLDLLAPKSGERILDLGCGDGALTEKLAERGIEVVGVDASPDQVQAAQRRGLDARVMDARDLTFHHEFDAVFSNAALHWVRQAEAVIAGVRRSLKPGGRFVGEMGGHGNVEAVRRALYTVLENRGIDPSPSDLWYFPTPEAYSTALREGGFAVRSIELFPRPTPLPGQVTDWLQTFAESFLNRVETDARPQLLTEVAEQLRPQLCADDGVWTVDYVRLRFFAERKD